MDTREKLNEFAELRGWNKHKLIGWSEATDFGDWLIKMSEFKQFRRTQIAEMRPVTQHEAENQDAILDNGISVPQADLENGSPKVGDMIARNPKNHKDQWLVAKQYFEDNFEPMQ